jgi:adenosylcobinamide-GDP ribazoletransferase
VRAALGFLTVLPVGGPHRAPDRAALLSFPLAGLLVGLAWALVGWAGTSTWTPLVGAALVVAVDLALTGALHADAVADVADGVASRRPSVEAIRIMREPAIGAVGAAALGAWLLLRVGFVAALAEAALWPLLVVAPVCGRAAMVLVLALAERPGGGSLAASVGAAASPPVAAGALGLAAGVSVACGLGAAGPAGAAVAAIALALAMAVAVAGERAWRRRFGALTGDGAGAIGASAEVAALALLAVG